MPVPSSAPVGAVSFIRGIASIRWRSTVSAGCLADRDSPKRRTMLRLNPRRLHYPTPPILSASLSIGLALDCELVSNTGRLCSSPTANSCQESGRGASMSLAWTDFQLHYSRSPICGQDLANTSWALMRDNRSGVLSPCPRALACARPWSCG